MGSRKPKSSRNRYIAVSAAAGILVLALGGVLLRLSPRPYQPLTAEDPDQVSTYLTHRLGPDFFNQVQFNEPFELLIDQQGLNDIISRGVWPQQFDEVVLETPAVLFEDDLLHVMSRISYYGLSSVLTVTAKPVMDEQGRLNVNIQAVRLGLVPITALAARIAETIVEDNAGAFDDWPQAKEIIMAVIANQPFEPSFYFDKRKIRIQQATLEPGRLRLRLAPENQAVYKY